MVQSYLRHGPTHAFGLVCSAGSNSVWDGKLAYVPALEDILVWDVKRGQMVAMWHETGHHSEVTCVERSPQGDIFAVGYADGSIKLWHTDSGTVSATLNGHRRSITALAFDDDGARLASGSQDTDLVLWDIVSNVGLYRFRGHRDQITAIKFVSLRNEMPTDSAVANVMSDYLLTTSKDTFMKLWQIAAQHCIQTIVAHSSEVWSLDIDIKHNIIVTGSGEGEVKIWRINRETSRETVLESEIEDIYKIITFVTILPLSSRHRISGLLFHSTRPYLAVQSYDKVIDIFRVRSEEEILKKRLRKKRREKEKPTVKEETGENLKVKAGDENSNKEEIDEIIRLKDIFVPYVALRASGKIRSFDFPRNSFESGKSCTVLLALASNAIEVYNIPNSKGTKDFTVEAAKLYSLDAPGHRTQIRCLSVSSDDSLLASISSDSLKIWNFKTTTCLRTMECNHTSCGSFLPGDRRLAVGTRTGEIFIFDIGASESVETIKAHTATIWSMHVSADGRELVSCSADKDVKIWEIERNLANGSASTDSTSIVSLAHTRTLKMSEDVLSVRYSPDGKLLAVSLIDSTVKIFYRDSLKFFLSLYGHKLPVLSMDISDDSKILVTCSADKSIKIWGLDFGDCHKSIFGHDESITQIAFERNSHFFWTVSKDKLLKYWDGDKFKLIQKFSGHHGEIRALIASNFGNFVVTASHDKSIRVWEKLDEPLFLEEERENELEISHDDKLVDAYSAPRQSFGSLVENNGSAKTALDAEATSVSKHTRETLLSGERIIEALDIADADNTARANHDDIRSKNVSEDADQLQALNRHPVLVAQDIEPEAYVLQVVEKISSTALTDALLILPFDKVLSLINYLDVWARKGWNISLVSRIVSFLIRIHYHQIVAQRSMRRTLVSLRRSIRIDLQNQRDILSYNFSALRYLQKQNRSERLMMFTDENTGSRLFDENARSEEMKRKRRMA